jgi:hypothetical protein
MSFLANKHFRTRCGNCWKQLQLEGVQISMLVVTVICAVVPIDVFLPAAIQISVPVALALVVLISLLVMSFLVTVGRHDDGKDFRTLLNQ